MNKDKIARAMVQQNATTLNGKADKSYVDTQIATTFNGKADKSYVDTQIASVNTSGQIVKNHKILHDYLDNPFNNFNIKIVGDSIVAGSGSSDYSLTGEDISTTGVKANAGVKCWAGMLKQLINSQYNGTVTVNANNKYITYSTTPTWNYNITTLSTMQGKLVGIGQYFSFTFKGTSFSLLLAKASYCPQLEIFVDDVSVQVLDLYNSTTTFDNEYVINGLTDTTHNVRCVIKLHPSYTSNNDIRLCGIKVTRNITVKNWGVSGQATGGLYSDRAKFIESTDDIVICQIGINDRISNYPNGTKALQQMFINYCVGLGKKFILAVSTPTSLTNQNDVTKKFKPYDLVRVLEELAIDNNMELINNYKYLMQYSKYTGVSLDTLLPDGIHPNDEGHSVLFKSFCDSLKLSYKRDDDV